MANRTFSENIEQLAKKISSGQSGQSGQQFDKFFMDLSDLDNIHHKDGKDFYIMLGKKKTNYKGIVTCSGKYNAKSIYGTSNYYKKISDSITTKKLIQEIIFNGIDWEEENDELSIESGNKIDIYTAPTLGAGTNEESKIEFFNTVMYNILRGYAVGRYSGDPFFSAITNEYLESYGTEFESGSCFTILKFIEYLSHACDGPVFKRQPDEIIVIYNPDNPFTQLGIQTDDGILDSSHTLNPFDCGVGEGRHCKEIFNSYSTFHSVDDGDPIHRWVNRDYDADAYFYIKEACFHLKFLENLKEQPDNNPENYKGTFSVPGNINRIGLFVKVIYIYEENNVVSGIIIHLNKEDIK